MQIHHRELQIDASRADSKTRTVSASLSSEEPVERAYGFEVLSHAPGAIDLSRAAGGLPLLFNHNPDQVIGIAEDVRLDGRKLRARLRFANTERATELWQLVTDGMLKGISIGYGIEDMERTGEQNGIPVFTVNRWQVFEATTTPLPADFKGAGIGRSIIHTRGKHTMETTTEERDSVKLGMQAERQRIADINETVKHFPHLRGLADRAITEGTEAEDFHRTALAAIHQRAGAQAGSYTGPAGRIYGAEPDSPAPEGRLLHSSSRLLRYFGGETRREQEANAYRVGMWARAQLFGDEQAQRWVHDYGSRALATNLSSKGASLVPVEMSNAIISLMEEYGIARQELRVIPMGSDTLSIPRRKGGVTAYFIGENNEITESDAEFDDVNLVARKLAVLTRMSSEIAEDAVIDLGSWLTEEIAYAFAEKEDDCMFNGDGTSTYGGIQGARNKLLGKAGAVNAGSGHDTFAEIDADDLQQLMSKLPQYAHRRAKWYCSQTAFQLIFQALGMAAGGATMIETGGVRMTAFAGYPIVISQAMPTDTGSLNGEVMLMFGNLSLAGTLGDRRSIRAMTDNSRYLERDQIAVQGTERFDIVIHDLGDDTTTGPVVGLVGN